MQDFQKLKVWEHAHQFTLEIYKISKLFPREEQFGLTSQIRRSASSIPTNIAEGCGRTSSADFARFLTIAAGSACEVEYQLLLACDLNYIDTRQFQTLNDSIHSIKRMLTGLNRKVLTNLTDN